MTEQIPEPNPAWWPYDYMDEVNPQGRPGPDAWIEDADGVAMLGPMEDGEMLETTLSDGDIVKFISCTVHAHIGLTVAADSFAFEFEPPTKFDQCCILDGLQSETLANSVEEMIGLLREFAPDEMLATQSFLASFYTFDDPQAYRFIAAERRFEKATAQ